MMAILFAAIQIFIGAIAIFWALWFGIKCVQRFLTQRERKCTAGVTQQDKGQGV